ncbi:RHS repeat-associated core domain-containing protein, partial [Dysgonomonas sp. Marseille-P4677]|uniref:RHS repeat-associated core domain-containing protein n=1 Tax=Dysgonomonas sp. Marseille-P4677 TaxID=2364790 RepID=UPI001F15F282
DMHQLNLYDYSARYYESAVGRFTSVDPRAEKFYSWSPYAYCYNNPIKFVDPDGKVPVLPIIIIVALLLNSDVVVAPTGDPSDGAKIQEARDNYNMNNLGILVPLPGGSGASTLSGTVGKQFIKETGKHAEKQVAKEVGKQIGKGVTHQTYTKQRPSDGKIYSGRTKGKGTPEENIAKRDKKHHKNKEGYGPAELDKSSSNGDAIRGREQQLIEKNGGAQSQGGTSGNSINGVNPKNPNSNKYDDAARKNFGAP